MLQPVMDLIRTVQPDCCGVAAGDTATVGTSASALEAFLDSAADPRGGGIDRSSYARHVP